MLIITPQQGRDRYKIIPKELQDLIFAETTKETFDHIGEENHLDGTKTYELGRVAGLVLLGFLHRDDTRKELQEALGINPMIANELQNELNKKLFAPVADILDKVYSPLSKATLSSAKPIDSIVPMKPVSFENMPKPSTLPPLVPPVAFPSTQVAPALTNGSLPATTKVSPLTFTKTPSLTPTPTEIPKPMVFVTQTGGQTAPVGNVPKFKIESLGTMTGSAFGGSSAPAFNSAPRPAKIELGFSSPEKKAPVAPSFTFETQKSTVRYGAPVAPTFSAPEIKPMTVAPLLPHKEEITMPKKVDVPASFKIPASPVLQPASPSLGGRGESVSPTPVSLDKSNPLPPMPPKFEPPKPLL